MNFELWSKASRSIAGAFDSEVEALAAVRAMRSIGMGAPMRKSLLCCARTIAVIRN